MVFFPMRSSENEYMIRVKIPEKYQQRAYDQIINSVSSDLPTSTSTSTHNTQFTIHNSQHTKLHST